MIKFVVYGANRSGSHYLQSMLHSHPEVNCYWDLFWKAGTTPWCFNTFLATHGVLKKPNFFKRKKLLYEFLNDHYSKSKDMRAAGFLLKWSTAKHFPAIMKWLKKNDSKIIHIVRENVLVQEIALQLRRSGFVPNHAREQIQFSEIRLETDDLVYRLREAKKKIERERCRVRKYDSIEVRYEALLLNERREMDTVLNFIGVKPRALISEFKKTESEAPSDMLENYDQVAKKLKDTEFSIYL